MRCPARQILAEWARIGGTKIVGADKITGAPLTLKLVNMPERQALDIILRNVAGFMAAPRLASAAPGASAYDRILILATSSAPRTGNARRPTVAAPAPINGGGDAACRRVRQIFRRRRRTTTPDEPTNGHDDQADTGVNQNQQPVFTFPAPTESARAPVFQPVQMGPPFGRPGQPGATDAGDHAAAERRTAAGDLQLRAHRSRRASPPPLVRPSSRLAVRRDRLADAGHDSAAGSPASTRTAAARQQ